MYFSILIHLNTEIFSFETYQSVYIIVDHAEL